MSQDYTYDVFLSHSTKDIDAAREISERLAADGLNVWLDEWEIRPGDLIGLSINRGLEKSRTLVLVLSANASESEWVTFESQTILFSDPTNQKRRFIPLRLDNAEIKDTLRQFAYVDWRDKSENEYSKLLAACQASPAPVSANEQEHVEVTKQILKGHTSFIYGLAMSHDGKRALSCSNDWTVRLWDLASQKCVGILKGHMRDVVDVSISSDGRRAVSGSYDRTLRVWDIPSQKCIAILEGHTDRVRALAMTPDGRTAVSCSDDGTLRMWDVLAQACISVTNKNVNSVAIAPSGQHILLCAHQDLYLETIDGKSIERFRGHLRRVNGVAVAANGKRAVSASDDRTVRVWDLASGACVTILEGHTSAVNGVAITADGRRAVSASNDKTVRVWDLETGANVAVLHGHTNAVMGITITTDGRQAVSISKDRTLRVWNLLPIGGEPTSDEFGTSRYTNAKVLLVGDSGVGKTGLAIRLTENRFEATISTDAAWATQLKLPHDASTEDTEREIWLWDFAGQADYRLIHQLFMDETSVAVLVFNPQSEDPFEGLGQWDRDLQRAARRPLRKLLVAGRCDRGGLMVTMASVERFRSERGFTRYLGTSAYTGQGCQALRDAIIQNIPWEDIPWTASPRIFKLLKEEIVRLKDEGKVLLRMAELKQQIEMRMPSDDFTIEHLRAVVGLLAGPGVVWQLEFGDFILLQPERINAYAAAVIRRVRSHTEEIGVIPEEDVLEGRLDYQDMSRLSPDEEQIVLRAMHQTFVDHGLCLREHTGAGTLLVFPSYFKRERPELEGHPAVFVTYQFNGQLDEIYSTLVVRLHHTGPFDKDQLWRFAADFKTPGRKRVGIKMTKRHEGTGEIAVYFDPDIPEDTKVTFIRYVHEHLKVKAQDVVRLRHYVCTRCHTPVENRRTALKRLNEGLTDILCVNCEGRVPLWDLIEKKFSSEEFQQKVRDLEEQARVSIDNESRELILIGHAFAIAGETGQSYRQYGNSNHGIDGEIEFKDDQGEASGKRVYLQLKSTNSFLHARNKDGEDVFTVKRPRHAQYWQEQPYPVMLVVRTFDGQIQWMNLTDYFRRQKRESNQMTFEGEPFTAMSLARLRARFFQSYKTPASPTDPQFDQI